MLRAAARPTVAHLAEPPADATLAPSVEDAPLHHPFRVWHQLVGRAGKARAGDGEVEGTLEQTAAEPAMIDHAEQ